MSRADRLAVLGALLLPLLLTWPMALDPTGTLLGSPFGEVDNHFWMYWRDGAGPGPWVNWPDGWEIPLMDVVNRPIARLGGALGPVFAYHLVVYLNLVLAGLGGWALAKELTDDVHAAWVGLVGAASAPFLGGILEFGVTEALPVGWLGLHLAAALRHARTGSLASLAASALALTAFLAAGWYHAVFVVVPEAVLLLHVVRRAPRRAGALALAALLAGATRVPALLELLETRNLWASRFRGVDPALPLVPDWRDVPRSGADLLNLALPRLDASPVSRSVYLGGVLLLFALAARARWVLFATAGLLLLALGHRLQVAGQVPLPGLLPAGWLVASFPSLGGLSHWDRALGPASLLLAAAAASGASRLTARRPWVGPALAALVLLDALGLAPTRFPRATYRPDPPAALLDLPPGAILLQLPVDDVGTRYEPPRSRRPYNQWQAYHQRPVAENYEGPDAVLGLPGVAALTVACGGPGPRRLPPGDAAAALRGAGFTHLALHPRLASRDCAPQLRALLGAPAVEAEDVVLWALDGVSPPGSPGPR